MPIAGAEKEEVSLYQLSVETDILLHRSGAETGTLTDPPEAWLSAQADVSIPVVRCPHLA